MEPGALEGGSRPIGTLDFRKLVHREIADLETLRAQLQLAIQLEMSTVPAYLVALYSIVDKSSEAYQLTRSVVVEEMLHVNVAANLLVAIGGVPYFTGPYSPSYPTYLPGANPQRTPYIALLPASTALYSDVFMAIERPAPFKAPAQGARYDSIAQFYKAIDEGLENVVERYGPAEVFKSQPGYCQRTDFYIGKGGGRPFLVRDLKTAKLAILEIVQQGEGAVSIDEPLQPEQHWGTYNAYGQRIDGTYGPILGKPRELAHYFKFQRIAQGLAPLGAVYPLVSNPDASSYTNPQAKELSRLFDQAFSVLLKALERSFRDADGDAYFKVTLPLMHEALPTYAGALMQTAALKEASSAVGPNALPAFRYVPEATLSALLAATRAKSGVVSEPSAKTAFAAAASAVEPAAGVPGFASLVERLVLAEGVSRTHDLSL